ncbi:Ankyrin repeat-containing protein ITN1 [Bienertia sinuspersici]
MKTVRQRINEGGAALMASSAMKEKNMSSMIKHLVKKASCVASWPDSKGSTPLHRAATLNKPDNLSITRLILKHFPQSAEICDANGKSILHLLINKIPTYQEAKNLLKIQQIHALRNHQDCQGNTPLHIAAKYKDINMLRVLLESETKLTINNGDGISATSLIQQQNVLQMLGKRQMTQMETEAADKIDINFLKQRMEKLENEFCVSQDSNGRNFLHILLEIKNESHIMIEDFIDFIKQVLERFPQLVFHRDGKGNTPVHVLVRNDDNIKIHIDTQPQIRINEPQQMSGDENEVDDRNNDDAEIRSLWRSRILSEILEMCKDCIVKTQQEANNNGGRHNKLPWLVQNNVDDNTPLHEAIIAKNKELVLKLLEYDNKAAGLSNKRKETPLHLLAGTPINHDGKSFSLFDDDEMEPFVEEDMKSIVRANGETVFWPDQDGLTPIHRAFKAGNIAAAAMLCIVSPEAAKMNDTNGQIFWHQLVKHPSHYFVYRLLRHEALRDLLAEKDKDGNTILHLAIQGYRFDIIQDFLEIWGQTSNKGLWLLNHCNEPYNSKELNSRPNTWLLDLLEISNKAGETPSELIAELPTLPSEIEKRILSDSRMMGIRSAWGIPKSQLQNYMNSMNVIAALLATITFTSAFTVPGGLFENIGTPIMIQSIAFQVFMISDVIAMCLSTMVLICLLWIMATSNKRDSVMIQDFAVTLLLSSLVATLLTFMAGVYAIFSSVKPWIAIATLVLCSLPSLLIHRIIVTKLLLPARNATLNLYMMIISGPAIRLRKNITKRMADKVRACRRRNYQSYPLEP